MTRATMTILLILLVGLFALNAQAQTPENGKKHGVCEFIDEDGDGYNDLAPDDDGDGIPNGMDEDYVRPEDGTGRQNKWGSAEDLDGEVFGKSAEDRGNGSGNRNGAGDGTGNDGDGPLDGTGFGPGDCDGDAECDGDGDQVMNRRGRTK